MSREHQPSKILGQAPLEPDDDSGGEPEAVLSFVLQRAFIKAGEEVLHLGNAKGGKQFNLLRLRNRCSMGARGPKSKGAKLCQGLGGMWRKPLV